MEIYQPYQNLGRDMSFGSHGNMCSGYLFFFLIFYPSLSTTLMIYNAICATHVIHMLCFMCATCTLYVQFTCNDAPGLTCVYTHDMHVYCSRPYVPSLIK